MTETVSCDASATNTSDAQLIYVRRTVASVPAAACTLILQVRAGGGAEAEHEADRLVGALTIA